LGGQATIVHETERALLLNVQLQFNESKDVWIPKYCILSPYQGDKSTMQQFQIKESFIATKLRVTTKKDPSREDKKRINSTIPEFRKKGIIQSNFNQEKPLSKNQEESSSIDFCVTQGYLMGFVMKSTDKAQLLRVPLSHGDFETVWVPKSVILNSITADRTKMQKVEIQQWWLNKKFT
jgi:hypothetical protein